MIISIDLSEPAQRNKQQTKKMKEPDDLEVTSSLKVPVDKFPGNLDDMTIVIKKRMIPFCWKDIAIDGPLENLRAPTGSKSRNCKISKSRPKIALTKRQSQSRAFVQDFKMLEEWKALGLVTSLLVILFLTRSLLYRSIQVSIYYY